MVDGASGGRNVGGANGGFQFPGTVLQLLSRDIIFITVEHCILQFSAGLGGDGMGNVPIDSVFIPAAGHGHKQPLRPLDHLDVVNGQIVVNGDRHHCPKPGVLIGSSDSDICDIHGSTAILLDVSWFDDRSGDDTGVLVVCTAVSRICTPAQNPLAQRKKVFIL